MAMPTTVTQFQRPGARGLVANAEARNLISRTLAGVAAVLFAVPVYRGASDDLVVPSGGPGAGDFMGLTRRSGVMDPANATPDSFAPADEVPIMLEGVMWVETADAVVAGVPANFNTTTSLWTDAAVAGSIIAVPGVEFDTAISAAGLAKVRVLRTIPA
jgi:hypothetical protein